MARKVLNFLKNLDVAVACISLAVLIVITALGVFMRYAVGDPFTWQEEVQLFLMVWIVFTGAGYAFRTGAHVAIEMLVDTFPEVLQKAVGILCDVVVLVTIAYLFRQSLGYVGMLFENGRSTSILDIPYWLQYGIAPVSYVIMIISYFTSKYLHKPENEEEV